RIRLNNVIELGDLLLHQLKRRILLALYSTSKTASILLGEETEGNDGYQVDVRGNGYQENSQRKCWMAQDDCEGLLVDRKHRHEYALACLVEPSVIMLPFQEPGTHRWSRRQRDQH